jgi:hypothetical protein
MSSADRVIRERPLQWPLPLTGPQSVILPLVMLDLHSRWSLPPSTLYNSPGVATVLHRRRHPDVVRVSVELPVVGDPQKFKGVLGRDGLAVHVDGDAVVVPAVVRN